MQFIKNIARKLPFSIKHKIKKLLGINIIPSSYGRTNLNHFIVTDINNSYALKVLYVFPVINWGFRFQRPQHFARGFARHDYKVFYFTTTFNYSITPGYTIRSIEGNVFEVTLNLDKEINIYKQVMDQDTKIFWLESIAKFEVDFGIFQKYIKLDHPFWIDFATSINGQLIYDCMDDHEGFEDGLEHVIELEKKAVASSDYLIVSSDKLYNKFSPLNRNCVLIENACDYDFFAQVNEPDEVNELKSKLNGKYVIGYFGAIANWFDLECVEYLVRKFGDYDFILIGNTTGCEEIHHLKTLPNVYLLGEKKYDLLPSYLSFFDVCLIPFKVIPLTLATNPVKMFEYLSQGKPVVSTKLPEVEKYGEVVYTALDKIEFADKVELALKEKDHVELIEKRKIVAKNNSWNNRFTQLTSFIENSITSDPKVSVVVLTYNNLNLTKNCLYSIYKYSNYSNLEVIVVDNFSTDSTRAWLSEFAQTKNNFKLILNDKNSGFSAGNNIGIKQASGEYVVVLNNDTFVSPNWIKNLLQHFSNDKVGMVGPVTNNIGNQAKIIVDSYFTEADFLKVATKIHYENLGKTYLMSKGALAFFCVMIRKSVIESVGLLDENFGRGWFEDDDYTLRMRLAGYQAMIADDVFIHHEHSASFGKLADDARLELFNKNRTYFETKHQIKWSPHVGER